MNNNGIYRGLDNESWKDVIDNKDLPLRWLALLLVHLILGLSYYHTWLSSSIPPTSLLPGAHYEKIAEAFLAEGYFASTPQELHHALTKAFTPNKSLPVVINVRICPSSSRKAQVSVCTILICAFYHVVQIVCLQCMFIDKWADKNTHHHNCSSFLNNY